MYIRKKGGSILNGTWIIIHEYSGLKTEKVGNTSFRLIFK